MIEIIKNCDALAELSIMERTLSIIKKKNPIKNQYLTTAVLSISHFASLRLYHY